MGNLGDLPRLVFIDEECGNLKVVVDGVELARNISKKKKPFYTPIDVCYAIREIVSSISTWNIVNQLHKHDFSCG